MKILKKISEKFQANNIQFNTDKKELFSSVAFLFVIYFIAMISIIRANFFYIDDLRRSVDGYELGGVFSRHISNLLGYFIHAGDYIKDISPLPQLVACLFLSLAGYTLVKIMCDKPNKLLLIASLPIGLSPYFSECLTYKFDAPYMALSILASVFPFLFMKKNRWLFSVICVISTLVMTMTYQAASGIFIMITLYVFFTNLNYKKTTIKNDFLFLGIAFISYCIAIIMFRLFFMQPVDFGYVSTSVAAIGNSMTVFLKNLQSYVVILYDDFNIKWKILSASIILLFYIKSILLSKKNKFLSFFLTTFFLAFFFISIFGLYLLLEVSYFGARAMYGFGIFIAILSIDICYSLKKIFAVPVIALIWCFFVFCFSYGNALADQKRYNDFRTELLLKDLSVLLPEKAETTYSIKLINSIRFSPMVRHTAKDNPMIWKLVPVGLRGGWPFGYMYLTQYYHFQLLRDDDIIDEDMPVVLDTYYHTIKIKDNNIAVILKTHNPY